jgi:hypothetical protein
MTDDGLKRHEALQRSKVRALRLTDAGDLRSAVATICLDVGKIFGGLDPLLHLLGSKRPATVPAQYVSSSADFTRASGNPPLRASQHVAEGHRIAGRVPRSHSPPAFLPPRIKG